MEQIILASELVSKIGLPKGVEWIWTNDPEICDLWNGKAVSPGFIGKLLKKDATE